MSDTVRVLSAGAPKAGLTPCAQAFRDLSAVNVDFDFNPAPALRKAIEREMRAGAGSASLASSGHHQLLIAPEALCQPLAEAGFLPAGAMVRIGGISAAVAVSADDEAPEVGTVASLKSALEEATAIVFNRASSGAYIETMLRGIDIDPAGPKVVRTDSGAEVVAYLAGDAPPGAVGFGQMTELRRLEAEGIKVAGALPAELAKVTTYLASLMPGGRGHAAAQGFLNYLASDDAREILRDVGIE